MTEADSSKNYQDVLTSRLQSGLHLTPGLSSKGIWTFYSHPIFIREPLYYPDPEASIPDCDF